MPRMFSYNNIGMGGNPYPVIHEHSDIGPENKKVIKQKHHLTEEDERAILGLPYRQTLEYLMKKYPYIDPDPAPEVKPNDRPDEVATSASQSEQVAELSAPQV